jgi:CDGSH-type Zn-finger protein
MAPDPVVIVPYQDGPYLVRGPVVLRDQEGHTISVGRRTVALCRCGKSRTRPFCDGTHQVIRFRAESAPEGVPASGGDTPPPHAGDGGTGRGGEGP